jgi:hypothetical protein
VLAKTTGHFYGYANLDGGLLLVPEPTAQIASLRFAGGTTLRLRDADVVGR